MILLTTSMIVLIVSDVAGPLRSAYSSLLPILAPPEGLGFTEAARPASQLASRVEPLEQRQRQQL